MILSDLLRTSVTDELGRKLGRVVDVRFVLEGHEAPSRARMVGLIVSPRSASSFLGYERATLQQPVILDRLLQWMHRGSFLVSWNDIHRIDEHGVHLRTGYTRQSSTLQD